MLALGPYPGRPPSRGHDPQDLDLVDRLEHLHGRRRGMGALAGLGEGPLPCRHEGLHPEALDDELEPSLGRGVEVAMRHKDVDQRFGRGQHVGPGHEVGQLDAQLRCFAQTSRAPQLVAGLAVADHRDEASVVEAGIVAAARGAAEGQVDAAG